MDGLDHDSGERKPVAPTPASRARPSFLARLTGPMAVMVVMAVLGVVIVFALFRSSSPGSPVAAVADSASVRPGSVPRAATGADTTIRPGDNAPGLPPFFRDWVDKGNNLFVVYYDPKDPGNAAVQDSIKAFTRQIMPPNTRTVATSVGGAGEPKFVSDGPTSWPVIYVVARGRNTRFSGLSSFHRSFASLFYPDSANTR